MVYIDDSGDTGLKSNGSPTDAFVLCAVIVEDRSWRTTLDEIVKFRRHLKEQFGLRMHDELKAGYLIHGTGPFRELGLSDKARMSIYRKALRFQRRLGTITTWATLAHKDRWEAETWTVGMRDRVWELMIERLETFTRKNQGRCAIYPDEGHPAFVRGLFRKMRRFSVIPSAIQAGTTVSRPAKLIVEDPSFRKSSESYFIQLADLNAYAAHRHVFPRDYFGSDYWDELGDCRLGAVNRFIRGSTPPTGIVVRPRERGPEPSSPEPVEGLMLGTRPRVSPQGRG